LFALGDNSCLGPPFLYVTLHGDPEPYNGVYKYSRDGCSYGNIIDPSATVLQPRDMLMYDDNNFVLTNAQDSQSKLWVFGDCGSKGVRPLKGVFVNGTQYPGLSHPFGITKSPKNDIYVSSQHTDNVLRFYGINSSQSGTALPFPTYITQTPPPSGMSWYAGTFVQYGAPNQHSDKEQGIRGIAFDGAGRLFVCNEDLPNLMIYNDSGYLVDQVPVENAIGIHYDPDTKYMFVGSKASSASVLAINTVDLKIVKQYTFDQMTHPAGIVTYNGILYVLDQGTERLLTFNVSSQVFMGAIVLSFPDDVEGLSLSNC